jgi:glutathione synthase/RimK-type ligase-like ATP-grasp enzyme
VILIATIGDDLHAQMVKALIDRRGLHCCRILELDRIAQRETLTYGIGYATSDRLLDSSGEVTSVSEAKVLWLRRVPGQQRLLEPLGDAYQRRVVDGDCRSGVLGLLKTHFRGTWVSSIEATVRASDKVWQLKTASECGFPIPRTLITQSAAAVMQFFESCGPLIVKTISGTPGPMLQTIKIDDPSIFSAEQYRVSPAIFQEYIAGSRHLRLACFGDDSLAGLIETSDVDWRGNLNVPMRSHPVDEGLHRSVRSVLDRLGLEMGIIDLKLRPDGEAVWLEVNPQGQFAFLDGLAGTNLMQRFAAFLDASCERR